VQVGVTVDVDASLAVRQAEVGAAVSLEINGPLVEGAR
jgi:hypothetical protein